MKVLTIKEPWASMILEGKKTIETRTWKTQHRGLIFLHASKNPKSKISGCIFAIARILKVEPMIKRHEKKALCEVYPNAYSWFLTDVRPIKLIKCKGKLGLWNLDNYEVRLKAMENL